jgi:hypothetical protein
MLPGLLALLLLAGSGCHSSDGPNDTSGRLLTFLLSPTIMKGAVASNNSESCEKYKG